MGKQPAELDIHNQALTTMTLPCRSQLAPAASKIRRSQAHSWSFDRQLWQHAVDLWSYGGHLQDLLFNAAGFPAQMIAIVRSQFPLTEGIETVEKVPTNSPDAAMAIGTLENGAFFAVQVEGAQPWRTGLLINITGTEGVLRVPTRSPCSTSTTTRSKA